MKASFKGESKSNKQSFNETNLMLNVNQQDQQHIVESSLKFDSIYFSSTTLKV